MLGGQMDVWTPESHSSLWMPCSGGCSLSSSAQKTRVLLSPTAQAGLGEPPHKRCQDESSLCMVPWTCPSKLTFQMGEETSLSPSLDPRLNTPWVDEWVRMGNAALHLHNTPTTLLRDPSCFLLFHRRLVASSCTQVIP